VADPIERRLAALLSADAVGYSRLMSEDDESTVRTLGTHRRGIERRIDDFRGRVVDAPGDNLLAEFPSVLGAVRCAVEIQRELAGRNEKVEPERRMAFRIGIHLGDVIVEGPRIYGSGVNIAARLEGLAEPGGICVSDFVYQQVRGKVDLPVADLGEQELKNIDEPVRAYRMTLADSQDASGPEPPRKLESAGLPLSGKPSLAVLPFSNTSGDESQEYFSDGIYDDILTELTRIPGLLVIGHDSMHTYRKTGATPARVARDLDVRHVLEGSIRREERRIRITARLVEGTTGRVVWSERFDRGLEDVFAVQDEIVQEVATALDVALVGGGNAFTIRKHLRNPKALGLLYRGSDLMDRFNREDMREAREIFEEVIRMEPESPIAYTNVAWTHYYEVQRGWSPDPEASLRAMAERVQRALELGDVSGFGSLMLSHMHLIKREHDEAMAMSERALAERPSCQGAYCMRANVLNYSGSPEEAVSNAKQAIRLSPVAPPFYPEVLANAYYLSGRLEEAIEAIHSTLKLAPDSLDARLLLAASLVETDRMDAARQAVAAVLALEPGLTLASFERSQPYRDADVLARLLHSLRRAGIPEGERAESVSEIAPPMTPSRRRVAPRPRA
jgi:TolB-like protein/Tfp pilus assembly protein PilF